MNWRKKLRGKIRLAEPLRNHTTFKIGGPAKFFIEPKDINDLKLLLELTKRDKIPIFVLGRGSNILISDKGLDAIVVRLNAPYFKKLSLVDNYLQLNCGVLVNDVVQFAKVQGLSGLEFLIGIPGTVGGALVMNAGVSEKVTSQKSPPQRFAPPTSAHPPILMAEAGPPIILADQVTSIGDLVEDVTVMDYDGNIKTLNKKDIKFGYRESNLLKYIILSARLRLIKKNKKEISDRIKKYIGYRIATQDLSKPSVGCIFKNPTDYSAGRLIDLCGLKGKRIGDAYVSQRHANFILNLGKAKARDVLRLMDLIRKEVVHKFNITLKPEIKIW